MSSFFKNRKEDFQDYLGGGFLPKVIALVLVVYLLLSLVLGVWWSQEPELFDVRAKTLALAEQEGLQPKVGFATTTALITLTETLLNKPGGYVTNDIFPPGLWLDNITNWEYGVLVQSRDLVRIFRKDLSRSQSQSLEDQDLTKADPQLHFDSNSWAIPATEAEYQRGIDAMYGYLRRLSDTTKPDAQFYARADNLRAWLAEVESRLGSLSRRLSESVGRPQLDMGLAGDASASQSTEGESMQERKTPWLKIDDVFYEARGTAWALVHILKAIEIDFAKVLSDKNALVSLRQIRLELEATQDMVWSPVILNGDGFGVLANHSLTMSSYISRASAATIDLRNLLEQG